MTTKNPIELEKIAIFAPTGRDGALVAQALAAEGDTRIVDSIEALCAMISEGAAATVLIAEEALTAESIQLLNEVLARQQPWSDLPIILMTSGGETTNTILNILKSISPTGNFTLLERPFRRITLLSLVQVALRSRRRQHEVKRLLEEQIAATRMRDEFISIASHELKTPLTALKLQAQFSQRLLARSAEGELPLIRTKKLIETTEQQVDRLARLVEDMLDISRINTGKLALARERFDLVELARETLERFTPQFEAARCPIRFLSHEPVVGFWDRYRMEQVLNNLVANALRYCPGAPITVSVSNAGSERAVLSVRDEGPGIAEASRDRIFQRFERAVSNSHLSGLGLGLFICKEIVESHGGTLRVESVLGKGSNFIMVVPSRSDALPNTKTA